MRTNKLAIFLFLLFATFATTASTTSADEMFGAFYATGTGVNSSVGYFHAMENLNEHVEIYQNMAPPGHMVSYVITGQSWDGFEYEIEYYIFVGLPLI
ncbi:MAG: hypothetical protein AB8B55_00285 [Mariniblastus sp.]